jgi:hypothetical protein
MLPDLKQEFTSLKWDPPLDGRSRIPFPSVFVFIQQIQKRSV